MAGLLRQDISLSNSRALTGSLLRSVFFITRYVKCIFRLAAGTGRFPPPVCVFYDTVREMYFPPCGGHGPVGQGKEGGAAASALLQRIHSPHGGVCAAFIPASLPVDHAI